MAITANIAPLLNFKRKVNKLIAERNTLLKASIQSKIMDKGNEEANMQLKACSNFFIASSKTLGNRIIISGIDTTPIDKHIAFVEFGTGIVGQARGYKGKLPDIWNYASGSHIDPTTGKWMYKKQHDSETQKKGGRYSTRGQISKHPMWNTRDYVNVNLMSLAKQGAMNYLITIIK